MDNLCNLIADGLKYCVGVVQIFAGIALVIILTTLIHEFLIGKNAIWRIK